MKKKILLLLSLISLTHTITPLHEWTEWCEKIKPVAAENYGTIIIWEKK